MPVLELDLEHPVREGLDDLAFHLELLFLRCYLTPPFTAKDTRRPGGEPAPSGRTISVTDVSSGKRLFFLGLIASLVLTAGIAIGVLLFGEFDSTAGKILSTTALLALFSLVALPGGVLIDQRRHVWLAYTTLALAVVAFALAMAVVWRDWESDGGETVGKLLALFASFAGASAQAATTTARLRPGDPRVVRLMYVAALGLGVLLASLIAVAVWAEVDSSGYFRVLGAVAVADVLLVVVQSVARRVGGPSPPAGGARSILVTGSPDAIEAAIPELERRGLTVEPGR